MIHLLFCTDSSRFFLSSLVLFVCIGCVWPPNANRFGGKVNTKMAKRRKRACWTINKKDVQCSCCIKTNRQANFQHAFFAWFQNAWFIYFNFTNILELNTHAITITSTVILSSIWYEFSSPKVSMTDRWNGSEQNVTQRKTVEVNSEYKHKVQRNSFELPDIQSVNIFYKCK